MEQQDKQIKKENKLKNFFKRYAVRIVIIALLVAFSNLSFHFFNTINENRYLQNYNKALHYCLSIDKFIKSFKTTKISNQQELLDILDGQLYQLDATIKSFSELEPFDGYEEQHNNILNHLKESRETLMQIKQTVKAGTDLISIFN